MSKISELKYEGSSFGARQRAVANTALKTFAALKTKIYLKTGPPT